MTIYAGKKDETLAITGTAEITPADLPESEYFGIMYRYTSSKDRLLTFDDLTIHAVFVRDTLAPELLSVSFAGRNAIRFLFNEEVLPGVKANVLIDEDASIPDTLFFSGNCLTASFTDPFQNDKRYSFSIKDICDRKGNSASSLNGSFEFFIPFLHDVIFTEVMADPSPPVYLPESEYLEIYNRSSHEIVLTGWSVDIGNHRYLFDDKVIKPGYYHLICPSASAWLFPQNITSPVISSSSALTNSGQLLVLRNYLGEIIDALVYSDTWYDDDAKLEGGWSLERIDNEFFCGNIANWKVSEATEGGTPGGINSVAGKVYDEEPPFVKQVIFDSTGSFRLVFSEPVEPANEETMLVPAGKKEMSIHSKLSQIFGDTLLISLESSVPDIPFPFVFRDEISDCSGNTIIPRDTILLGSPARPVTTDIIISEILYAPFPGCPEFIELLNRSGKLLNLRDLKLAVGSEDSGFREKYLTGEGILFPPGCYLVLSRFPETLSWYYDIVDRKTLFPFPDMPSLSNDGGTVRLCLRSGEVIDEMIYDPGHQYPLLDDDHGISLERMTEDEEPGISAPWHSASSLSGFATPGYRNSQYLPSSKGKSTLSVEKEIFSPNNDGKDDVAIFRFHFEREGYVGTFRIFDPAGRIVRTVGVNELLSPEGMFTWDGAGDDGQPCSTGIYLGYLEAWHLSGKRKAFRQTVVLDRSSP